MARDLVARRMITSVFEPIQPHGIFSSRARQPLAEWPWAALGIPRHFEPATVQQADGHLPVARCRPAYSIARLSAAALRCGASANDRNCGARHCRTLRGLLRRAMLREPQAGTVAVVAHARDVLAQLRRGRDPVPRLQEFKPWPGNGITRVSKRAFTDLVAVGTASRNRVTARDQVALQGSAGPIRGNRAARAAARVDIGGGQLALMCHALCYSTPDLYRLRNIVYMIKVKRIFDHFRPSQ